MCIGLLVVVKGKDTKQIVVIHLSEHILQFSYF